MRRLLGLVLFVICTLLLFTETSYAHPGKTDSNGGHWDHSTGTYHYHHGYPAHQHTGGKCPYKFDDNSSRDLSPQKGIDGELGRYKPTFLEILPFAGMTIAFNLIGVSFISHMFCGKNKMLKVTAVAAWYAIYAPILIAFFKSNAPAIMWIKNNGYFWFVGVGTILVMIPLMYWKISGKDGVVSTILFSIPIIALLIFLSAIPVACTLLLFSVI